jgi:outer membrane protein OmpA-like peptidoglycan-associated protein
MVPYSSLIGKDTAIVINNLFFEVDKADILPTSIPELKRMVRLLQWLGVAVEIEGHTDSSGTEEYNQALSEARAEAVCQALVQLGLKDCKLTARGYGETRPIADNDTPEGRQLNRRVAIRFYKK